MGSYFIKKWWIICITFSLFLSLIPLESHASAPRKLNYQGYLTNASGTPVSATVPIVFSIYDQENATTPVWSESRSVAVAKGYYSVNLGDGTPLNLPFDRPYFLGVKVGADAEMTPRQPLTSVGYAYRANVADAVPDGSITAAKIGIDCADGQVLQKTVSGWACGTPVVGTGGGTITGVMAGSGLTGGGLSGNVTLAVDFAGTGTAATAAKSDHDHDDIYRKKYGKVAVVAQSGGDYTDPIAAMAAVATWCGAPSGNNPCLVRIMPGVYDLGTGTLKMRRHVDIEGSGRFSTVITGTIDSTTAGVVSGASSAELRHLKVANTGGAANAAAIAVYNNNEAARLDDVIVAASGAADNYGVYNDAASSTLRRVQSTATGGSNSYALYNRTSGTVIVRGSVLSADTNTIYNGDGVVTQVNDTTFTGKGTVYGVGKVACAATYDADNRFFPNTCAPNGANFYVSGTIPPQQFVEVKGAAPPTNTQISATFSAAVNPATIGSTTFIVQDFGGSPVAGTVSYDDQLRTAFFVPKTPLASVAQYTAIVKKDVRDMTGQTLYDDVTWSFTTGGSADSVAPTVYSTSPWDKSVNVAPASSLTLAFSETIDAKTLNSDTFSVTDGNGVAVPGKLTNPAGAASQFVWTPAKPFSFNTTYTASLTTGVKDLAGNGMKTPYTWSFTTQTGPAPTGLAVTASGLKTTISWDAVSGATSYNLYWSNVFGVSKQNGNKISNVTSPYTHSGLTDNTVYNYVVTAVAGNVESADSSQAYVVVDATKPTVVSTIPAADAAGVSIDSTVRATFSEAMTGLSVNASTFTVKDSLGNPVSGSIPNLGYLTMFEFVPSAALNYNTKYTATITTGAKDASGNSLASDYSWSFTTLPVSTPTGLTAATGNLQTTLTWSPAGGADHYNLYWSTTPGVTKTNGTKIANVTSPYLHSGLSDNTTYYYIVTAVNGSGGESPGSNEVSSRFDKTAPKVVMTAPASNATGVGINAAVNVWFSEDIDQTTINTTTFTLKNANGIAVNGYSNAWGNNFQFNPAPALEYNTTYTATLTTGIKDRSGNALSSNYSWSFTTPIPAPTGLAVTRGNLQSNLSWNPVPGVTSYNVYWSNASGVNKSTGTKISGITSTSYTHSGLANGSFYHYVVTAVSGNSESEVSNEVSANFDTTAPTVVSNNIYNGTADPYFFNSIQLQFNEGLTVATVNEGTVLLEDGNHNAVPFILQYWGGSSVTLSVPDGLKYNTTYAVKVTTGVQDLAGNNMVQDYVLSFNTIALPAPNGVTAVPGAGGTTISWQQVYARNVYYNVYWSSTPGVTKATGNKVTGATSPYVHSGEGNYFVVTAVSGDSESAVSAEVNRAGLVAPTNVSGHAGSNSTSTTLSWGAVAGAAGYNVYWSPDPFVGKSQASLISNVTSPYNHTGLPLSGHTYFYAVTAVKDSIEGPMSAVFPAATNPPLP